MLQLEELIKNASIHLYKWIVLNNTISDVKNVIAVPQIWNTFKPCVP